MKSMYSTQSSKLEVAIREQFNAIAAQNCKHTLTENARVFKCLKGLDVDFRNVHCYTQQTFQEAIRPQNFFVEMQYG